MAIEGPSNTKTAEKKAKTKATDEQVEANEQNSTDTTSSVGDKNIIGLQGKDGSDTEYKPEDDKPFVR